MPRILLLNRTDAERLLLNRTDAETLLLERHRQRPGASDPHRQRASPRTTPMTRGPLITLAAIAVVLALTTAIVVTSNGEGGPVSEGSAQGSNTVATGPIVAFYGDSYTLGIGASDKSKRWSTLICGERNWREVNPSVNGLGFVNNRSVAIDEPGEVIAARPDIVFITMGLNDNFSYDRAATEIHRRIDVDFSRLKGALPAARFIAVEPFWYTDERPESLGVISGWVKSAASDIGADFVPGASHWIQHHPEWMATDRLHPNNKGYAEMTRRMNAELKKLDL